MAPSLMPSRPCFGTDSSAALLPLHHRLRHLSQQQQQQQGPSTSQPVEVSPRACPPVADLPRRDPLRRPLWPAVSPAVHQLAPLLSLLILLAIPPCLSRGFPRTGGAAAVGPQSAGAISIFPVVISSSAHLSFFSIQYTFSAAVSCCRKPHLGENRGSDYMSTCACSWLIIICHCFVVMWPLISVAVVQASCFLGLPLMVMRLQYAPISCLGCAVIFK